MPSASSLRELLIRLNGKQPPLRDSDAPERAEENLMPDPGLGYSQFNEVLLLLGYDRVSSAFFQYLLSDSTEYKLGSAFTSLEKLEFGIERFRKDAMWFYGNIRHALSRLSTGDTSELEDMLKRRAPRDESDFEQRHAPVQHIEAIPAKDTYLLGYVIEDEIEKALVANPDDASALRLKERMDAARTAGKKNHDLYLTWDHMDVYVATSMRERHQFYSVNQTARAIFGHEELTGLKLRYFDPTQAYCKSRLDKGLAEALMLKRADCTVYLVQEADSFGKDSELASTLAQGKVVIAFVPKLESKDQFIAELKTMHQEVYQDRDWVDVLRDLLCSFDPRVAWHNTAIRKWLDDPSALSTEQIETNLFETAQNVYDKRARLLLETHPLGLQVDLDTGVANGVLVARSHEECARLVRAAIMYKLEFSIETAKDGTLLLRERNTNSVARVVTGNELLTNAFWNFYPA